MTVINYFEFILPICRGCPYIIYRVSNDIRPQIAPKKWYRPLTARWPRFPRRTIMYLTAFFSFVLFFSFVAKTEKDITSMLTIGFNKVRCTVRSMFYLSSYFLIAFVNVCAHRAGYREQPVSCRIFGNKNLENRNRFRKTDTTTAT